MKYPPSELIINNDESIDHLNVTQEEVADTIILVGDPDRVKKVSKYFDSIEVQKQKREFCTHTGFLNEKRLTVISTGIGTDNIDIVLNELDALKNIDFKTREDKPEFTQLQFIRIGTSGSIRKELPLDKFLISEMAIGLDGLGQYYTLMNQDLATKFHFELLADLKMAMPYSSQCSPDLLSLFTDYEKGITLTAAGFYGPQGRSIRLKNKIEPLFEKIRAFHYKDLKCTNLEMETAAIYLLAQLMGHQAISCNAIIANRVTNTFSKNSGKVVDDLIKEVLLKITQA